MTRSFRAAELCERDDLKMRDNKDDDLAFFQEMRKRVKERKNLGLFQNTHQFEVSLGQLTSAPVRKNWIFEFLNSNNHKNEYDWLITPPDTPALPSLIKESEQTVRSQIGTPNSRVTACKAKVTKPQPEALGRMSLSTRQQVSIPKPNLSIRLHKREGRGSGTGTPTDHSTLRSTTLTHSMFPSSRSSALPGVSASNVKRPSRLSSISTSRRKNSAPCTIEYMNASPFSKTTLKNIMQSRPISPTERSRSWNPSEIPGFSFDVPPNLRISVSERSPSATRGRPEAPRSAVERVSSGRTRKQSHSLVRDQPSIGLTNSSGTYVPANRLHSKANDNISSSGVGTKIDGRRMNMRKLVSGNKHRKQSIFRNLSMKSCSTDIEKCSPNKSLDMAMKHMDINKSIKENLWPSRSRVSASSMYSVPTGSVSISRFEKSSSPASSEMNVNNNNIARFMEFDDVPSKSILAAAKLCGRR